MSRCCPPSARRAIASGAPVDFYPGSVERAPPDSTQKRFRDAWVHTYATYGGHEGCEAALLAGLEAADKATNEGLSAAGVRACSPLRADSAERYAFYARGALATIACVDYPYPTGFIAPLPANPVQAACKALVAGGGEGGQSALAALHAATLGMVNSSGDLRCLDLRAELVGQPYDKPRQAYGQASGQAPINGHASGRAH